MANLKKSFSASRQAVSGLAALTRHRLLGQPRPRYAGSLRLKGLSAPVEVLRDKWGVPHIYAGSTPDLLFAQGYIHAQERLWQMDFNRRLVAGRLSEILGSATVSLDRWMRTLTMRRVAESEVSLLDEQSRQLVDSYVAGINACIELEALPLEFRLLNYRPEPWTPADSLSWVKMMCWTLCVNWESEILRARLIARLGPEAAASLEPTVPPEWVRVVPRGVDYSCIGKTALQRAAESRPFTGPGGRQGVGSNNWVLSGSRTTTGMPILANDMHLGMGAPAVWYENHLSSDDLHVTGVSFPGLPLVIAGHNEKVAWGFTNGFPDVQDLYMEHLRKTPEGRTEYEYRGEWLEAEVRREEIRVRDAEPVIEEVVLTRHGPIINSLIEGEGMELPLAMRWTALDPANALPALHGMNRAESCEAFREAVRGWYWPTQNMVYADRQGNIGYSFPGHIPIRARGNGAVPVPGWTGEYEWTGYIPYEELPHMFNPAPGYIASANNRVVDEGYPYWVSLDYCTSGRARRIVELIEEKGTLSLEDIRQMHMDQVSILARETMMRALEGIDPADPELLPVFQMFQGWDGHISAGSPQAAVYEIFYRLMIRDITTPKLGELAPRYAGKGPTPLLYEGSLFGDHSREWLLTVLSDPHSPWWEGDGELGRVELIRRTLKEAVAMLRESCGPAMQDWSWGKIHQLVFAHPLGSVKPLDRVFNRGPYPIGGDGDTIWASMIGSVDLQGRDIIGPPFRFIADLSDWNRSQGILVPGQSGHPASRHYDDNIAGWFKGEYHPMLFDREQVMTQITDRLVMEPETSGKGNDAPLMG
ncbi:MAG: penicillin acylase family protein [Syntrophothermus sp.]